MPPSAPFRIYEEAALANDLPHIEATLPSSAFLNVELRDLAENLFDQFREMSFDGEGISRETYGPGETAAMEVIERLANERGFVIEWDAARNLIIRLEGREPDLPVVATGSAVARRTHLLPVRASGTRTCASNRASVPFQESQRQR